MDVTPLVREGQQIIQSYNQQGFSVSGIKYEGAIIVQPHQTVLWDTAQNFKTLDLNDFEGLCAIAEHLDVVLLGTGQFMEFVSPSFRKDLKSKGLHIEVMDTGAACRTYNVLMAEGRRVAAALIIPGTSD